MVTDLAAGGAAEHLVCADLLLQGFRAFMTDQNCPYDVAVDLGRLIRIQVKSTRQPRTVSGSERPGYRFRIGRSAGSGRKTYAEGAFELIACVALDTRLIAYFPPSLHVQSFVIGLPGMGRGKQFADFPFTKAVAELGAGDYG